MQKTKEEKTGVKVSTIAEDNGSGAKKKIIAVVIVVIVIVAIIAFLVTREDGDSNGGNNGENHPPSADIVIEQEDFYVNRTIYFNSTAMDLDGDELSYSWDFEDGETSNKANTTHEYTLAGTFNVTLTVTDGHGGEDVESVKIEVKDVPTVTMSVQKYQPPILPPEYTVTIDSITTPLDTNFVHFYVIDGATQDVLVEGNVADYTGLHTLGYVYFTDDDGDGNISEDDTFLIADDPLNELGIDDGDIFRLKMEESDDLLGQIALE